MSMYICECPHIYSYTQRYDNIMCSEVDVLKLLDWPSRVCHACSELPLQHMLRGVGSYSWGASEAVGHLWCRAGSAACAFTPRSDMSWVLSMLVGFVRGVKKKKRVRNITGVALLT